MHKSTQFGWLDNSRNNKMGGNYIFFILCLLFLSSTRGKWTYSGDQILRLSVTNDYEAQLVLGLRGYDFWTEVGLNRYSMQCLRKKENYWSYEILDQLQKQQIKDTPPKPPIVYRILDFFIENKIVHKINSNNSYIICSHLDKHQNCYFLICNECGLVEECCNEELKKAILHTTSKNDFLEQNISLEIMGLCKNCQNKL